MSTYSYYNIKKTVVDKLIYNVELIIPNETRDYGKLILYLKDNKDINDTDIFYNNYQLIFNFNLIFYNDNKPLFIKTLSGAIFDYRLLKGKVIKTIDKIMAKTRSSFYEKYIITMSNGCKYKIITFYLQLKYNIVSIEKITYNPLIKYNQNS